MRVKIGNRQIERSAHDVAQTLLARQILIDESPIESPSIQCTAHSVHLIGRYQLRRYKGVGQSIFGYCRRALCLPGNSNLRELRRSQDDCMALVGLMKCDGG